MADKGKGKGKSGGRGYRGPQSAMPTLQGGLTLRNLVTVRNSISIGLDPSLKVHAVTFTVKSGSCEVMILRDEADFESGNGLSLQDFNSKQVELLPEYQVVKAALDVLAGGAKHNTSDPDQVTEHALVAPENFDMLKTAFDAITGAVGPKAVLGTNLAKKICDVMQNMRQAKIMVECSREVKKISSTAGEYEAMVEYGDSLDSGFVLLDATAAGEIWTFNLPKNQTATDAVNGLDPKSSARAICIKKAQRVVWADLEDMEIHYRHFLGGACFFNQWYAGSLDPSQTAGQRGTRDLVTTIDFCWGTGSFGYII